SSIQCSAARTAAAGPELRPTAATNAPISLSASAICCRHSTTGPLTVLCSIQVLRLSPTHAVAVLSQSPVISVIAFMTSCISSAPTSARAFLEVQQVPLPQQPLAKGTARLRKQLGDLLGRCCTCPVA